MDKYTLVLYRGSNKSKVILQKNLTELANRDSTILCALAPVLAKSKEEAEIKLKENLKKLLGK